MFGHYYVKLGSCYSMWRSKQVCLKLVPDGGRPVQMPYSQMQNRMPGHPIWYP